MIKINSENNKQILIQKIEYFSKLAKFYARIKVD